MENGVDVTKGYQQPDVAPVWKIILVASIAAGIQFGWALQLSLLTPYVQMLGLPHAAASFIWLCGPVSGMLVQPIVGYYSDKCSSSFGRRRPFIGAGAGLVVVAVFLIGFAADIGHSFGDVLTKHTKPRAVAIFVVGFWILDVANNMLQGPCRAFLADLSGGNPRKLSSANAWFSFFMAVGNVLGYSAGSYSHLWRFFPFSKTDACDIFCANLKSCFFFSITLLLILTITALSIVKEPDSAAAAADQLTKIEQGGVPIFGELFSAMKNLSKPMWLLMLVTALNWIAWFPFLLYDTDWMGREVYGGRVGEPIYDTGVRAGSIGLMLNSVVLAFSSLVVLVLARGANAAKRLWFGVNILFAICLAMTILVTRYADHLRRYGADGSVLPPPFGVKASALAIFAITGIPLSVTFSIPFALASIYCITSDAGQGLSLGLLNISICIPQMIISVSTGPLDSLFGGGNLPGFVLGAVAATISAILALVLLPSKKSDKPLTITGGFH